MPPYDKTFNPPAPVLELIVQHPEEPLRSVSLAAQTDTAADISCIPLSQITALGLKRADVITVIGYDGRPTDNILYLVTLQIADHTLNRVRTIAIPGDLFVLGRNVLNHFNVTLRGKDQSFDMLDP